MLDLFKKVLAFKKQINENQMIFKYLKLTSKYYL